MYRNVGGTPPPPFIFWKCSIEKERGGSAAREMSHRLQSRDAVRRVFRMEWRVGSIDPPSEEVFRPASLFRKRNPFTVTREKAMLADVSGSDTRYGSQGVPSPVIVAPEIHFHSRP